MAEGRYNSYVIMGKGGEMPIVIDWTKVKAFASLKRKKYRLEGIDFFTTHYANRESLIAELINAEALSPAAARGIKLQIYQVKQDKKSPDGVAFKPNGSLQFGLAYKAYLPLLKYDNVVIRTLQEHLDDYTFINALVTKYKKEGPYNDFIFDALENKIHKIENSLHYNFEGVEKQRNALRSYYYRYNQMRVVRGLLDSMLAYASHKTHSDGEVRSAYNNAREFFLRIKYQVTFAKDDIDDATKLSFKTNKDGSRAVKYLEFHNFIMWLGSQLDLELGEYAQINDQIVYPLASKKKKIKKREKRKEVDGQTSLFDNPPYESDKPLTGDIDEQMSLFPSHYESFSDMAIDDNDELDHYGKQHIKTKK